MGWFKDLFFGEGVAHSIIMLAIVIAIGIMFGKIKIKGISLGVTWILFIGIAFAHFGMRVDGEILHIFKEFGLILFVYSIGMQVGPGFFSSFRKGGIRLNMLAAGIVLLGCMVTYMIYLFTDIPMPTMVGIMSGAVTNTPGLGAAQQANLDITGIDDTNIATGYAVAYPLAVVGIIVTILVLRKIFKVNIKREEELASADDASSDSARRLSLRVTNPALEGMKVGEIHDMIKRNFVISRRRSADGTVKMVNAETILHMGDDILVITSPAATPAITAFIGVEEEELDWNQLNAQLISRKILITKNQVNAKTISQLRLRSFGVSITRVNRSGVDLVAAPNLQLFIGDSVTVVGTEGAIKEVDKILGNSLKRLDHPNLLAIFFGIVMGVILGSIPFTIPGIPQPVKLGLAGGPLIVAILMSRFGSRYKLVTYATASANLMLREIGISIFLACVGLGAGESFVDTIVAGGYKWVGYGVMITLIPILTIGFIGRKALKLNFLTLSGLLAGSMTDPPVLAYANEMSGNDIPAISYATVYPLTMFLRVLCAQLLILMFV